MMPPAEAHVYQSWFDKDEHAPALPRNLATVAWATPKYSKSQVNKAGDLLKATPPDELFYPVNWDDALNVINNWRSIHSYPLQIVKMTLLQRAQAVARQGRSKALVAQRLKRLESIWVKLRNEPTMQLSTMQDIGGCRAIVRSMNEVRRIEKVYERSIAAKPLRGPEFSQRFDHIRKPKLSGYRSLHYVFKYRGDSEEHKCYNGLRIEVQIRSQLQHAWATAVETVSVLTHQALKSNVGTDDWKRFFALMGSAIAIREKTAAVPGTPENQRELFDELQHYASILTVHDILSGYGYAVFELIGKEKDAEAFLVVLDPTTKEVDVTAFGPGELLKAESEYLETERNLNKDNGQQAVLVSAESISSLKRAYPNYFLDTGAFLDALAIAVAK
jgi:ppGpp synthetase/RelA/SpoT-type nucleotidyltranferase